MYIETETIRLVNGPNPWQGRVEVFYARGWGTVCDDSWDDMDARVVCAQLGYTGGIALVDLEYGKGTGTILLDDVSCSGDEVNIADCDRQPWFLHDCGHGEDAGVKCGEYQETAFFMLKSCTINLSLHNHLIYWIIKGWHSK